MSAAPEKAKPGRKPLADGEGKTARMEMRMTPEQKAKAQDRGAAAGVSATAWVLALIDAAP